MVWYGMVWYGMAWHGMVWYGMVWYGMVWYGGMPDDPTSGLRHHVILCGGDYLASDGGLFRLLSSQGRSHNTADL